MLTTILELNKRVLVVDGDIFEIPEYTQMWIDDKLKFICKGEDLTEEIAESLIPIKDKDSAKKYPKAFLVSYKRFTNAFIGVLENQGFYWLENPIEKPEYPKSGYVNELAKLIEQWQEAESKTFKNPLIFEIL